MYNELVRQLLKKHFGTPNKSLVIGTDVAANNERYYYSLKNGEEIMALRGLLEEQHLAYGIEEIPWLEQRFDGPLEDKKKIRQCVTFYETGGCWYLIVNNIVGISYSSDNTGRVTAIVLLDESRPLAILSGDDISSFFGYWRKDNNRVSRECNQKEGFSHGMNKVLLSNISFRNFTSDFFYEVSKIEHNYILKDVARTISKNGCFLPEIAYEDLIKFRTPAELIHSFSSADIDLNIDFNKTDINAGYLMTKFAPEIDKKDWHYLSRLDPNEIVKAVITDMPGEIITEKFVKKYLINKTSVAGADIMVLGCVDDYIKLCQTMNIPFRINFDRNGLMRAHDELSMRYRREASEQKQKEPLLKKPSQFDELEKAIAQTGSKEFERICSMERLLDEGERQHNCVFSRDDVVRSDMASIYHWSHKGKSYTIQFSKNQSGEYYLQEIKARFNIPVLEEHLSDLKQILYGICIIDNNCASMQFEEEQENYDNSNSDEQYYDYDFPF